MQRASFIALAIGVVSTLGCSREALPVLPDENLTVEGEEAPSQLGPESPLATGFREPSYSAAEAEAILSAYHHLDPDHVVPEGLLRRAVLYFHANQALISNKNYLSVIDYAARSSRRRFFVVNLANGNVWALHTAHGSGSDPNNNGLLDWVSNVPDSHMSSRGYMLTAETYQGKYGRSLRLDGLSATNSKVRERAVVVHGSNYVQDREVQQGRSWGCPAVPMAYKERLIDMIAGGSLIYAGLSAEHWTPVR